MIAGLFHEGSGLGNQLHRYVATRVLAEDKGYGWGMIHPENFKGDSFMSLAMGINPERTPLFNKSETWPHEIAMLSWTEKEVRQNAVDIRGYDPEINFVQDNTIIDGEFQDPRYFEHRLDDIAEWLRVEPLEIPDDLCVIGFRGGEYKIFPDLFLPKSYFDEGIAKMRELNPNMRFQVHTDDVFSAKEYFPDLECIHDIGINWRSMRYAKHAIIANSSFYILPRLLSRGTTIAPRYWARHNTKTWALPQNFYKPFTYIV